MKALAWYTAIFNALIIIIFILAVAGVVPPPPFTASEGIVWAVLTVPVVILGILVIKRPA
ncbi:MAG: hypothetical protein HY530_00205 [Chloroflexi bacterium]|nr:hypothetical protein [Chloroflexota bacterium]